MTRNPTRNPTKADSFRRHSKRNGHCTPPKASKSSRTVSTSRSACTTSSSGSTIASACFFNRREQKTVPKLTDTQEERISDWLQKYGTELYRAAAEQNRVSVSCLGRRSKKKLVKHVLQNEAVRRFPCFATVSHAAFMDLEMKLKSKGKITETGKQTTNGMTNGRFKKHPTVKHLMGNVNASPRVEDEYWKLIDNASLWDKHPEELSTYIQTRAKRLFTNGKLGEDYYYLREMNREKKVDDETTLRKFGPKERKKWSTTVNKRIEGLLKLCKDDHDLVAAFSLSHEFAHISKRILCSRSFPQCMVSPEVKDHKFWKDRFLIAGKEKDSKLFRGVALDTVLGTVWNADLEWKNCVWKCKLTPIDKRRWKQYVARNDFSLSAFDDRSPCRFAREGNIDLDCEHCYEALENGSILLKPLPSVWGGGGCGKK
ncbi:hypothetical protein FGB62_29g131 [Gracilaria domingensis]|nr:hypothetical protein FGB62_29g131 [Gracilaria domingensis]